MDGVKYKFVKHRAIGGQIAGGHELAVLLGRRSVDQAEDVVEALAVEGVLVPERCLVAGLLGLELEPVRARERHRHAWVATGDQGQGRELIDRVFLPADRRQIEHVDQAVTSLVEEREHHGTHHGVSELVVALRRGLEHAEEIIEQLVADDDPLAVRIVERVDGSAVDGLDLDVRR